MTKQKFKSTLSVLTLLAGFFLVSLQAMDLADEVLDFMKATVPDDDDRWDVEPE